MKAKWLAAGAVIATCCAALAQVPVELGEPLTPPEEHYRLNVRYVPEKGRIEGNGTIRVKNTTQYELRRLRLAWSGKEPSDLKITVRERPVELRNSGGELWQIELPVPLAVGKEIEIDASFHRAVNKLEPGEALPLTEWHPRLFWGYETQASFDVGIDAPEAAVIACSGRKDPLTGRYVATGVRSFGLWFGQGYKVIEAASEGTLVRVLFLPSMTKCAETLVANATDAIHFYRKRFGFYPQPSLTIIPGEPAPVTGGFPFATAMVMIHSMESFSDLSDTHWRWISAHEIGHQYWLEHVMAKDPEAQWGWLMVGLGLWMDREYSRERGMLETHPELMAKYADMVRSGVNTTVEMPPDQIRQQKYNYNSRVTHDKAFGIVSALAAILGPRTFDRVHLRCLREYGGRRMGTAEFRRVAEEDSGQDLGWFFVPWLKTNGYASYEVTGLEKATEAGVHIASTRIRQAGSIAIPVPVEARFEDGSRARLWIDRFRQEQTLEWRSEAPLKAIVIDPDHEFPLVTPPPVQEYQDLVSKVIDLPWTGAGETARGLYDQVPKLKVKDPDVLFKMWMLLYDGRFYEEALDACRRAALEYKNTDKSRRFLSTTWQGILLDLLGRREEALGRYREALSIAGHAKIRHPQYNMVIDRSFVEQRLKEPFSRE